MKKETINEEKNQKIIEEKILLDIYNNMLYPPPIGKYNKDLNFDSSLNMNSLIPIKVKNNNVILGEGGFSKVQLYQNKTTKIKYAVKKMNLTQLEKLSQNKKFILNEVNIQGRINHPNIIKLYNYFEIKNNCILILEYASKGTLFDLINLKNGLSERIAFYYFIQTLNAIYFLHLHSIIHRDLKPENLLINENNILKLCDFGWSVKLKNDKRTTFCGTVEYMAPEIIQKQKYDETIDVWSLGVLLYELVHSYSPFCSEDSDYRKIGNNIIQREFEFKEGLSNEYIDLINKILIKDSEKRIKIEEIYQHPFMTKHINTIYREINSGNYTYNDKNLNVKLNDKTQIENLKKKSLVKYINIDNNNSVTTNEIDDITYDTNEKIKNNSNLNKKNINTSKVNKIKEHSNDSKVKPKAYINSRQHNNDLDNYTNIEINYMFDSIPTEPEAKILPDSKKCKDIKKVNSKIYIKKNNNNSPMKKKNENNHLILNTSRNKRKIIDIGNEQKQSLFKNQNKISHVKSFSLGQNNLNYSHLKDNKLKIIISINNTQNKNYINKNENLSTKNKKIFHSHFEEYPPNGRIFNKINHIHQKNGCNKSKNHTTKNNKTINQIILEENKNIIPNNINSNSTIKYREIDYNEYSTNNVNQKKTKKNYIKNISYIKNNNIKIDNNNCSPYTTLINTSNPNNSSNIIKNNTNKNSPKSILKTRNAFKLNDIIKNQKIPNSSNNNSKFLRRIKSESQSNIFLTNIKNNLSNRIKNKMRNIYHSKNLSKFNELKQLSIVNIHKSMKPSYIHKIIIKNINNLNNSININNSNKLKTEDNNNLQNLTQNIDLTMINQNIINNNIQTAVINNYNLSKIKKNNSCRNKKVITFPKSKVIKNIILESNKRNGNNSKDRVIHKTNV